MIPFIAANIKLGLPSGIGPVGKPNSSNSVKTFKNAFVLEYPFLNLDANNKGNGTDSVVF